MQTITTISSLRATIHTWRQAGETIAFVPTMGNLHAGHLRLVEEAKKRASRVVASIFVNPTQFGPGEDFSAYPRTPKEDSDKLEEAGTDLLFMPGPCEVYPQGASTYVEVPGLSDELCGAFRPGHFRGVATVVLKLFNMVQPDMALFGEKDYQQLAVIRRMALDLDVPVKIVGIATVREASGLAMSSRNGYLSEEQRNQAALIYQCLLAAKAELEAGARDFSAIESKQARVLQDAGFRPDYFSIRKAGDLRQPDADTTEFVVLAAARLGKARLIDNLRFQI